MVGRDKLYNFILVRTPAFPIHWIDIAYAGWPAGGRRYLDNIRVL
jgi:hypothetical protein